MGSIFDAIERRRIDSAEQGVGDVSILDDAPMRAGIGHLPSLLASIAGNGFVLQLGPNVSLMPFVLPQDSGGSILYPNANCEDGCREIACVWAPNLRRIIDAQQGLAILEMMATDGLAISPTTLVGTNRQLRSIGQFRGIPGGSTAFLRTAHPALWPMDLPEVYGNGEFARLDTAHAAMLNRLNELIAVYTRYTADPGNSMFRMAFTDSLLMLRSLYVALGLSTQLACQVFARRNLVGLRAAYSRATRSRSCRPFAAAWLSLSPPSLYAVGCVRFPLPFYTGSGPTPVGQVSTALVDMLEQALQGNQSVVDTQYRTNDTTALCEALTNSGSIAPPAMLNAMVMSCS